MSSKTKIVVLHMKEIIYTVIFAVLAIVLILLLIFMFRPGHHSGSNDKKIYTPGIYTSDITLNNTALEVEVTVDETHINSIRFTNQVLLHRHRRYLIRKQHNLHVRISLFHPCGRLLQSVYITPFSPRSFPAGGR